MHVKMITTVQYRLSVMLCRSRQYACKNDYNSTENIVITVTHIKMDNRNQEILALKDLV